MHNERNQLLDANFKLPSCKKLNSAHVLVNTCWLVGTWTKNGWQHFLTCNKNAERSRPVFILTNVSNYVFFCCTSIWRALFRWKGVRYFKTTKPRYKNDRAPVMKSFSLLKSDQWFEKQEITSALKMLRTSNFMLSPPQLSHKYIRGWENILRMVFVSFLLLPIFFKPSNPSNPRYPSNPRDTAS